ncbi:hypothetical protein VTJ83DRAFT_2316 [Remersonia thermophila]|uniref:DNA mismatch repair protein n=1 Tax=Remersonia thermophila TaxID=72144 RepID=A0ABR4DIN2_9PEZI
MLAPRRAPIPPHRIACLSSRARPIPPCQAATLGWSIRPNVTAAALLSSLSSSSSAAASPAAAAVGRRRSPSASWHGSRHRPPYALAPLLHVRGKKTRTTVSLDDLPQGLVVPPSGPLPPVTAGGGIAAEEEEDKEGPAYPTVVLQARRNMDKFDNCVLLTRVGGFYELYLEQAEEYGPLLNLKIAHKKTNAGPVPMAGFPFFQLDRFLKILVQDYNRHVAIAEEFPNDPSEKVRSGGLMHTRRVTRIVTPGTLIDENFMDPYANNYVMAIHVSQPARTEEDGPGRQREAEPVELPRDAAGNLGLAWLDVSTGSFYTQPATLGSLSAILTRVSPREIVLDRALERDENNALLSILQEERHLVTYSSGKGDLRGLADWRPVLEADVPAETAAAMTGDEVQAGSLLIHYVGDRLRGLSMKLQPPVRHEAMHVMTIDKNSMRALELKQTIRDGAFRGSLLHAIRRTVTKSGARLLGEWLGAPSTSLEVINFRQNLVARFLEDEDLRDAVVALLRRTHDSQRLVQRFALNRGDPDDLLRLANTIKATEDIVSLLKASAGRQPRTEAKSKGSPKPPDDCLAVMVDRISLDHPRRLARAIRDAIDEEGLVQRHQMEDNEAGEMMALAQEIVKAEGSDQDEALLPKVASAKAAKRKASAGGTTSLREHYGEDNEVWIMKPGASEMLSRLHAQLADLRRQKDELTETLRVRLGAASLTLRWTPGLGHICHVKGKDAKRAPSMKPAEPAPDGQQDQPPEQEQPPIRTLSTSRTTRSFHLPEWTSLGESLDATRLQIRGEEQRVFASLRARVVRNLVRLRRNARVLDELDIATSFARLAAEKGLVRPAVTAAPQTVIIGGRHPTVEGGLEEQGRTFQPNDCVIGSVGGGVAGLGSSSSPLPLPSSSPSSSSSQATEHNEQEKEEEKEEEQQLQQGQPSPSPPPAASAAKPARIWLITGPNMAGKSTFLRQTALITILAQLGSYVPASYASIGLADAIYSRVGSADNLYADQSTFMVEMLETAAILRQATPRSLVIMDEVGRGTTPEDGTAVAFAALHHLATVNRCRALFATHFHAVADLCAEHGLAAGDPGEHGGSVDMYCTDVAEDEDGGFVYVHKLRRGVNRQSHALKVARLAGVPDEAIRVAKQVLERETGADASSSFSLQGDNAGQIRKHGNESGVAAAAAAAAAVG